MGKSSELVYKPCIARRHRRVNTDCEPSRVVAIVPETSAVSV